MLQIDRGQLTAKLHNLPVRSKSQGPTAFEATFLPAFGGRPVAVFRLKQVFDQMLFACLCWRRNVIGLSGIPSVDGGAGRSI
ncbi:MAG: hypothetical protein CMI01_16845 [Oceanospirillaceae bacterium]|jgi:hypothetical protein|nr:hypothetical protein [Oceanospirillaceae bacterium]